MEKVDGSMSDGGEAFEQTDFFENSLLEFWVEQSVKDEMQSPSENSDSK